MKKIYILMATIILGGCVTTTMDISPSQSYRPNGAKELWRITGNLDSKYTEGLIQNNTSRILYVYINGNLVIRGGLSNHATGELSGSYQGHEIISSCFSELKTSIWLDIRCMILVDNERAVTLTF